MPLDGYNRTSRISNSVGCGAALLIFAIFLTLVGGIMYGVSRRQEKTFNDPFFKEHVESTVVMNTVGVVFLVIGGVTLYFAIILCTIAACQAKNQENGRLTEPTSAAPQPPPHYAYPHQPPSQNVYPPTGFFPAQPVISGIPAQSKRRYPPQHADYYPPSSSVVPPPGNLYHPPSYAQAVAPNAPLQTFSSADGPNNQPLEQKP